jgi:2-polyprenyl-3-methyl-5-hydroxy-6-metoxy-1,4-benzoquinol methylase
MKETIHGNKKRIKFISECLRKFNPLSVLDIGCGNGVFLTIPLAEQFENITFCGIDSDEPTIALAKKHNQLKNLAYYTNDEFLSHNKYDIIIASEVIEHVEEPHQFLLWIKTHLSEHGHIIITTPNGYGCFEFTTFFETILDLSGIMKVLSTLPFLSSLKVGNSYTNNDLQEKQHDTLAISPHVNFFSYRKLKKVFAESGLIEKMYKPRSMFGGLGFNQLFRSESVLEWNASISDSMPRQIVSGWMFVLENNPDFSSDTTPKYKRSLNEQWRRWLTAKRWKII